MINTLADWFYAVGFGLSLTLIPFTIFYVYLALKEGKFVLQDDGEKDGI